MRDHFENTWTKTKSFTNVDSEGIKKLEYEMKNARAVEIATQTGDYEEIINQLKDGGLWEEQLIRVREKFNSSIDTDNFPTKQKAVWEMLTVLYLYDQGTAEHCIETYKLLRKRIEKIATGNLFLAEILRKENHEMERVYFASLTHDIGKVCIPPFIINNKLTREEWDDLLLEMSRNNELDQITKERLAMADGVDYDKDEFLEKLKESGLRSKDIVPVKKGLSDEEKSELEEKWKLSSELPLMKIIDKHADFSREIHQQKGFNKTGELVGQHHNKKEKDVKLILPEGIQKPSSDLGNIIQIADIEQALKSKRPYHKAFSDIEIIKGLKREIGNSDIGKAIEYFWLKDKLDHFLKENNPKSLDSLSEFDKQSLLDINKYLKELRTGDSGKAIENWINTHIRN